MNGSNVDIDGESARRANQANWEDRVPVHEEAYGLDAFDDPDHLSDVVRDDLAAMAVFLRRAACQDSTCATCSATSARTPSHWLAPA